MAAQSNHWAILDRQTVFHLGSKYSVLLFQHIASLVNLDRVSSKTFTVPELRSMLGVTEGKLDRFSNLMQKALRPAIEDINHLSRLKLKITPKKIGRTVSTVEISWSVKPDPSATKRELNSAKVGRKERSKNAADVLYEPFPLDGTIHFTKWETIARKYLPSPTPDLGRVSSAFRAFSTDRGFELTAHNIDKVFVSFCQKYKQ